MASPSVLQGSKIFIFSPYITPILSIRRSRQEREVGQEASELKRIAILLPLSNTYSTVLNPFPDFNQILNYRNLANFLTILLKPLCTISNVFKENCGQFPRKAPANLLRSLN